MTKWLSDKADANDIAMLDNLINERAAVGWELVTYDFMATVKISVLYVYIYSSFIRYYLNFIYYYIILY